MPSLWKLSYYELKQIVPLSWPLLAFGLDHGFIQTDVGMCFCLDEVSRKGTSDEQDVDLLCATDEDSIRRSIYGRVSDAERNSVAVKSQWVHVLLWLSCMRGHDANEILDWVERIYAEFDYPKEIAPFVRYMPTKGMANTPEGLTNALKRHLDEWRKKMFTDRDMNETDAHSSVFKITCREVLLVPDDSSGCI